MSYKAFKVKRLQEGKIIQVDINRQKALNAMNPDFFEQLHIIFRQINRDQNARVVVLLGEGKGFSAGLDLKQFSSFFTFNSADDSARNSILVYEGVKKMQHQFLSLIECKVPVLVGIHNFCIGGAIDLISMADIRYCTEDAKFAIKQIDIGMAADLGTLQIFPNIIGNESTFRELAFTGRTMGAEEAKSIGLVSKIVKDKKQLEKALLQLAKTIAAKSPVAIYTMKQIMKREIYKKVLDSLDYMARTNSAMLLTKDTITAITAFLTKTKPQFGKL